MKPSTSIRRRLLAPVVPLLALLLTTGCVNAEVWGDSLTTQSQAYASLGAHGQSVKVRSFPGTALCDWLGDMSAERQSEHPGAVVIAFTGNHFGPCTQSVTDIPSLVANYELSLRRVRLIFPTERIVVIGIPAMANPVSQKATIALNAMYRRVAPQIGAVYSSAADDALTPGHVFRWSAPRFPCLGVAPGPCQLVVVRTPDGAHLTPEGQKWFGWALTADATKPR